MTILVHAAVRCRMQECVEVPNAPASWWKGCWNGAVTRILQVLGVLARLLPSSKVIFLAGARGQRSLLIQQRRSFPRAFKSGRGCHARLSRLFCDFPARMLPSLYRLGPERLDPT